MPFNPEARAWIYAVSIPSSAAYRSIKMILNGPGLEAIPEGRREEAYRITFPEAAQAVRESFEVEDTWGRWTDGEWRSEYTRILLYNVAKDSDPVLIRLRHAEDEYRGQLGDSLLGDSLDESTD